jgi:diaminohydroxyphosphoribosylaminopyrimidine deaminase/5-amino-6-(5-phosphoribosylamino)uracil reductase
MSAEADRLYLQATVELAARGMNSTTPNPRVGCLIVQSGIVVGRGWHIRAGAGHAEVNALNDAGPEVARGATAYVSLEPCAFQGRTPACSRTLIDAGITRVVAAMTDPHPKVAGQGFAQLEAAGVEVEVIELPEAHALNAGYISRISRGLPFVRIKMAMSLDGRTAMASGESQWITGAAARADVQAWRARSCAIVTGSETVLADDPAMNVRAESATEAGEIRQPLRVILDSRLRIPASAKILQPPGKALIVHTSGRPAADATEHLQLEEKEANRVDLESLLRELAGRDCNEVLIEAGPTLTGAVIAAGLWDELLLYVAPRLLGSDARPLAYLPLERMVDAIGATIVDRVMVGEDVRLRLQPSA